MKLYFTQIDPPEEEVCAILRQRGWACESLSMREANELEPEPWQPEAYRALVLTSRRACSWLSSRYELSKLPPLAVVGNRSRSQLQDAGARFLLPLHDEAPANALALAASLKAILNPHEQLLWLCGEESSQDLILDQGQLDKRIVYCTRRREPIPQPPEPSSMVYFQSPSAVADYCTLFPQPFRIAAIGPATERAILRLNWHVDFTPSRPESSIFARELPEPAIFLSQVKT